MKKLKHDYNDRELDDTVNKLERGDYNAMSVYTHAPTVSPIKINRYTVNQSNYNVVGNLLIRSISQGSSGSANTVILNFIAFEIHNGGVERIFIFRQPNEVDGFIATCSELDGEGDEGSKSRRRADLF